MDCLLWQRLRGDFPPHDVPFVEPTADVDPEEPRPMAMVLAYRGAGFLGWQVQNKGRTVQGVVERKLSQLMDRPVRIVAAGRTDTGVHALGQVASFEAYGRLDPPRMIQALNSMMPPDVRIRALGSVAPDFHARYSVTGKTYEYYLWPQADPGMFLDGHCWPLGHALNVEAMRRALAHLVGDVDLAAFAAHSNDLDGSTVRRVSDALIEPAGDGMLVVRLSGSGFLRHVVRNIVGTLSQVGRDRLPPRAIAEMLEAGQRLYPGPKAPPGGLYLARVYYG